MTSVLVRLFTVLALLAASAGCGGDASETGEEAAVTPAADAPASGIESDGVSLKLVL